MRYDIGVSTLAGEDTTLEPHRDKVLLIVNVASRCGFTRQYKGLQALYDRYAGRGFAVLGFPCNQFGAQEPGSPEEIAEFCRASYGVTFPMFSKIDVNGPGRHPLYQELTAVADGDGQAGDVIWNFEKFLVTPNGEIRRFRSSVKPSADELVAAIEAALPRGS